MDPPTEQPESDPAVEPESDPLVDYLEAPPPARRAQLAALRESHPDRARRIDRLLGRLEDIGFLEEPDEAAPGLPERIGDYEILRLLGTGGMGVVYLAEHRNLGRRVALKVIHEGLASTPKARERFRREALAASRLDHPNICTVYEVGTDGDTPFLAMRLVPGQTLAQILAGSRGDGSGVRLPGSEGGETTPSIAAILQFVERAALALHVAHEAGLVHRDVKPGNIMVTPDGEPVLLDFGLARIEDSSTDGLTLSSDQLGTPMYMAPEQVAGRQASRTTDIHALAVVLYECLTHRPPFTGLNRESLFRQILREEPSDPRRVNRAIRRELWTVLQTALAKEPDRRYVSAAAFAEDLRRVRMHEPILARRPGPILRLQRFAQRNPVAASFLAFLLLAVMGFVLLLYQRGVALAEKGAIEQALRANDGRRTAPARALANALDAIQANRNVDTVSALYLAMAQSRERLRLWHDNAVWRVLFSPDDRHVATCSDDYTARLWDSSGNLLHVMPHDMPVQDCRFSHGGERIATAARDGTAAIWDLQGNRLHELVHGPWFRGSGIGKLDDFEDPANSAWVLRIRWSHDDRFVATTCVDRRIRVWDTETGSQYGPSFAGHVDREGYYCRQEWSPVENLLVSCEGHSSARHYEHDPTSIVFVWRPGAESHEITARFRHPDAVYSVGFAPDGRSVLTACADGHWRIWDLDRQDEPVASARVGDLAIRARYSPDGQQVLASSSDRHLGIWRRSGDTPLARRRLDTTMRPTWGPHGSLGLASDPWILTYGRDQSVRLLDPDLQQALEFRGHSERVAFMALAPDGRRLASASWDNTARIWDVIDEDMPRMLAHRGPVTALAHGPGDTVISVSHDGTMRIWDLRRLTSRVIATTSDYPAGLATLPDRRMAAIVFRSGRVDRYDLTTGQGTRLDRPHDHQMNCVLFLGDGRLVVGGGRNELLHCYAPDNTSSSTFGTSRYRSLALARAERRELVAAAGWAYQIQVWDESSGDLLQAWTTSTRDYKHALAFSHDELRLAVGGGGGLLQVWDVSDLERPRPDVLSLSGHEGRVTSIAWSPNDSLLATASSDGSARLWDAHTGEPIAVLRGHRGLLNAVLFTTDDRFLLTGGDDGAIQAWPTDLDELIALAEERVARLRAAPNPVGDRIVQAAVRHGCPYLLTRIAWWIIDPMAGVDEPDLALAKQAAVKAVELIGGRNQVKLAAATQVLLELCRASAVALDPELAETLGHCVDGASKAGNVRLLNRIARAIVDPEVQLEMRQSLLDLAMRAATRAVELTDRRDAGILDTLARAFYWRRDYERAEALQEEAVAVRIAKQGPGSAEDLESVLEEYRKLVGTAESR